MANITLDTILLPPNMFWVDEIEWTPVEQNTEYSTEGNLLIETGEKLAGRPITLQSTDNNSCWVTRKIVLDLLAFAYVPGKTMKLTLADGREFDVQFNSAKGKPVEANPIVERVPPLLTDMNTLIIRLMEV